MNVASSHERSILPWTRHPPTRMLRMATLPNSVPGHQPGPVTNVPPASQGAGSQVQIGRLSSSPTSRHGPLLTLHSQTHLSPLPVLLGWFRTCPTTATWNQLWGTVGRCPAQVQACRQWGGSAGTQRGTRQSRMGLQAPNADGEERNWILLLDEYSGIAPGDGIRQLITSGGAVSVGLCVDAAPFARS